MSVQPAEREVAKYAGMYRKALRIKGIQEPEEKTARYAARLRAMYASPQFRAHDVYPTMNVRSVYAVIAMCLELRAFGLSDAAIMAFTDAAFSGRRAFFDGLIRLIDRLPNSFQIARRWNIKDHARRVRDHSITYERFEVTGDAVTYRISKCMYVEMFEAYGIRELCKIFCNTDTRCYSGLARHVIFIRHSDLSDGPCCADEVRRR